VDERLLNTLKILTGAGVKPLLIKSYPKPGKDVDVLVRNSLEFELAKKALEKAGYRIGREKDNKVMCFPPKASLLKVHLHRHVSWSEIIYLTAKEVWGRSRKVRVCGVEFYLPSPEDEFLIRCLHSFFENQYVSSRDAEAKSLIPGINLDKLRLIAGEHGLTPFVNLFIEMLARRRVKYPIAQFIKCYVYKLLYDAKNNRLTIRQALVYARNLVRLLRRWLTC